MMTETLNVYLKMGLRYVIKSKKNIKNQILLALRYIKKGNDTIYY